MADTLKELLALEASPWFKFVHPDAKSTMNTVKDFLSGLAERRGVAAAIALVLHRDFYKQMVRMAAGFVKWTTPAAVYYGPQAPHPLESYPRAAR